MWQVSKTRHHIFYNDNQCKEINISFFSFNVEDSIGNMEATEANKKYKWTKIQNQNKTHWIESQQILELIFSLLIHLQCASGQFPNLMLSGT